MAGNNPLSGGSTLAAGNTSEIQYNGGGGAFASSSNFTYSGGLLSVTGGTVSATNGYFGTVSATAYYGDGSHLTGISTQGDRIVSGTLSAIANSATGYISLTTAGTNWGYLSSGVNYLPNLRTTTLSATTAIQIGSNSLTCNTGISGTMRYSAISSTMEYCNGSVWSSMGPSSTQPIAFSTYLSGSAQSVTANTWTRVALNTVIFDTNNNFDATTNHRFTPTVPGKYLFTGAVACGVGTGFCSAALYKNGAGAAQGASYSTTTAANAPVNYILDMNGTTDYVELYAYLAGASVSAGSIQTYFGGVLLAPQGSSGGGATPAGSTADVQYNSGGALGADTGNFTYASGVLKAPAVSATTISATNISGTMIQAGAGGSCSMGTVGAIRRNPVTNKLQVCQDH